MEDHDNSNVTVLKLKPRRKELNADIFDKLIDPAGLVFSKDFCLNTLIADEERKTA